VPAPIVSPRYARVVPTASAGKSHAPHARAVVTPVRLAANTACLARQGTLFMLPLVFQWPVVPVATARVVMLPAVRCAPVEHTRTIPRLPRVHLALPATTVLSPRGHPYSAVKGMLAVRMPRLALLAYWDKHPTHSIRTASVVLLAILVG
jgi:hypothetical protein